ncbi:hypothetical protein ACXGSE_00175 [Enterococcus hirae]
MKLKLNLLQNSYDHLINFLFSYRAANKDFNSISYYHQLKLKSALIDLCQAYELLLKQVLFNVQPNLIYTDIDKKNLLNAHTVSFKNSINRVRNFTDYKFEDDEKNFLYTFNNFRNSFVHYETDIHIDELRTYCLKALDYYFALHNYFFKNINLNFLKDKPLEKKIIVLLNELREIHNNYIFYHGYALAKEDLEVLLEIQKEKNPEILLLEGSLQYKRIKFGEENSIFDSQDLNEKISGIYECNYCPECMVPLGELHLYSLPCDLEVCPNCFNQLLSCQCDFSH